MATPYITIGCPTTGGGRVQEGDSSFLIEGIPIACVGHKATCPLHKTVSTIVSGDQYFKVGGKPAARAGDSLSCGCKLLPKQSLVVGDNSGGSGSSSNLNATNFSNQTYDEQFILKTDENEILANTPYTIKMADGSLKHGITDNAGKTERIVTNQAEKLEIYLGHL